MAKTSPSVQGPCEATNSSWLDWQHIGHVVQQHLQARLWLCWFTPSLAGGAAAAADHTMTWTLMRSIIAAIQSSLITLKTHTGPETAEGGEVAV